MSPEEWKNNLRLTGYFYKLVNAVRPFTKYRSFQVSLDVLSLEKMTAITLYYLKYQGSMKMTAIVQFV